jgi:hypothetical protein
VNAASQVKYQTEQENEVRYGDCEFITVLMTQSVTQNNDLEEGDEFRRKSKIAIINENRKIWMNPGPASTNTAGKSG